MIYMLNAVKSADIGSQRLALLDSQIEASDIGLRFNKKITTFATSTVDPRRPVLMGHKVHRASVANGF